MILSHKHRFIFLKTQKTAGSSLELALSGLCGPRDIITPLLPQEEALRPGHGAQNYLKNACEHQVIRTDGLYKALRGQDYFNHMKARQVAEAAPREWESYFKFGFVRNPWDTQVSQFFWRRRGKGDLSPAEFRRYLLEPDGDRSFRTLQIKGKFAVDFVGRYENLDSDYQSAIRKIGLCSAPTLLRLKAYTRPAAARDYRAFYDDQTREHIARECALVIDKFGYEF